MSYPDKSYPWLEDIENSRDLNGNEKQQFGFLIAWMETWRIPKRLEPGVETARRFWKEAVLVKKRETWQLDQWTQAVRWYLQWLELCKTKGLRARSVPERMSEAVHHLGARRGLALIPLGDSNETNAGVISLNGKARRRSGVGTMTEEKRSH